MVYLNKTFHKNGRTACLHCGPIWDPLWKGNVLVSDVARRNSQALATGPIVYNRFVSMDARSWTRLLCLYMDSPLVPEAKRQQVSLICTNNRRPVLARQPHGITKTSRRSTCCRQVVEVSKGGRSLFSQRKRPPSFVLPSLSPAIRRSSDDVVQRRQSPSEAG